MLLDGVLLSLLVGALDGSVHEGKARCFRHHASDLKSLHDTRTRSAHWRHMLLDGVLLSLLVGALDGSVHEGKARCFRHHASGAGNRLSGQYSLCPIRLSQNE